MHLLLVLGLAWLPCLPASAQARQHPSATDTPGVTRYAPDYFADAAPASAWDMVSRLPGFTVMDPDEDIRGYAEARGNVLVDGARPTSKYAGTEDVLKRIPAGSVKYIALVRSSKAGIDMGSYAVVANVVLRRQTTSHLSATGGMLASTDGWLAPTGRLQYTRNTHDHNLRIALKLDPELDDDSGRGTRRELEPNGELAARDRLDTRTTKRKGEASANWEGRLGTGKLALNAALRGERERTGTRYAPTLGDGVGERITEAEDSSATEAGARYTRHPDPRSTLKLMATWRLHQLDVTEHSRQGDEDEHFREHTRAGESIVRADLRHEWSDSLATRASLEGAYNFLDSNTHLQAQGNDVTPPGSDVRVEEKRAAVAFGVEWQPSHAWAFESGLRVEQSTLTQTGDTPTTRHFRYLKPRLAVHWYPDDANQWHLAVARKVGQLDFDDFVASASLDTGVVSAGNAALEPERSTHFELGLEHHLPNDGAIAVTLMHDDIENVIDRVLVTTPDAVFDAPGNIGPGRRDTLKLDLLLPLDRIGFHGGQLRSSLQWRHSRVTDPVTGDTRPISEEKPVDGDITLSQDLPAWRMNWGITLEHIAERETKYRYDEIKRESEGMGWTLFVERRLGSRWRMRFEATDLFGRGFRQTRRKYAGPRSTSALDEIERRRRTSPGYVILTFRYSPGDP